MKQFHVLACDYDGTLAKHGRVNDATLTALENVRQSGRRLVMVTGRRLNELLEVFPAARMFDRIVAENGAVILTPATGAETLLAEPPPPRFVELLIARGVAPIAVGRTIVATWEPHETQVLETIRDLGLGLQIVLNKGAVMVLPSDVSKATGLKKALDQLGYSPRNTLAVGDAENDHALLEYCECGAAVANALSALKERADVVLERDHGDGVIDLIEQLLEDDLAAWTAKHARRRLELGHVNRDEPLLLPASGVNLRLESTRLELLAPLLNQLTSQLSHHGYQWCAVTGEAVLEHAETTTVLGTEKRAPSPDEVSQALERPRQSVLVQCGALNAFERGPFLTAVVNRLREIREAFGRPHWMIWYGMREGLESASVDLDSLGTGIVLADLRDDASDQSPQSTHWLRIRDRRAIAGAGAGGFDATASARSVLDWIDSENGALHFVSPADHAHAPMRFNV